MVLSSFAFKNVVSLKCLFCLFFLGGLTRCQGPGWFWLVQNVPFRFLMGA